MEILKIRNNFKLKIIEYLLELDSNPSRLTKFMGLAMEIQENGFVIQKDLFKLARNNGYTLKDYGKCLKILRDRGDIIGKMGFCLVLHPKYKLFAKCEGVFVFTAE